MSLFGQFLEISLPVDDIQESLAWYKQLGFEECPVGDIYNHHYAVVTDGRIYLGLHDGWPDEFTLTFVRQELVKHIPQLEALGLESDEIYQGEERFHEVTLFDPDGMALRLLEARSFSATDADAAPLTGKLRNISIFTRQPDVLTQFWETGGLDRHDDDDDEESFELLTRGLGINVTEGRGKTSLNFFCQDMSTLESFLLNEDLSYKKKAGVITLLSPEGTRLIISDRY